MCVVFYWHLYAILASFQKTKNVMLCYVIRGCDKGQKHKAMPKNVKEELKSFPITSKVMK